MGEITIEDLRTLTSKYVAAEPARLGTEGWWQTPLLASATIDQRFDVLCQIATHDHMHPHDLLPTAKSLIVFFIVGLVLLSFVNIDKAKEAKSAGLFSD